MRFSGTAVSFLARTFSGIMLFTTVFLLGTVSAGESVEDRGYRWFEVEVLVFRYTDVEIEDPEQFPLAVRPISIHNSRDLYTERLTPPIESLYYALPVCEGKRRWVAPLRSAFLSGALFAEENQLPSAQRIGCRRLHDDALVRSFYAKQTELKTVAPAHLPLVMSGTKQGTREEMLRAETPFLVPREQFALTPLRQQLERRRDASPILHTAWRQPVFTRTVGRRHRLVGGKNYTDQFDYFGFPVSPANQQVQERLQHYLNYHLNGVSMDDEGPFAGLLTVLDAADRGEFRLSRPNSDDLRFPERPGQNPRGIPEQVWEFDGLMHIYLVGNYLHIDTDFNLREPITVSAAARDVREQVRDFLEPDAHELEFLRAYPFQQLRRVISHQTHYFDHPNYGVVVQIRRTDLSNRR